MQFDVIQKSPKMSNIWATFRCNKILYQGLSKVAQFGHSNQEMDNDRNERRNTVGRKIEAHKRDLVFKGKLPPPRRRQLRKCVTICGTFPLPSPTST